MLTFLLTRTPTGPAKTAKIGGAGERSGAVRYYRVDVAYNLFGEYSVMREWGPTGSSGQRLLVWFSNLREACMAAERWRKRAMRRGYSMEGQIE